MTSLKCCGTWVIENNPDEPTTHTFFQGDCLSTLPEVRADLVFCSPPYEARRAYGIDFNLKGEQWVGWAKERFEACLEASRGLVAWVVEGGTSNFSYSATPLLLAADLKRAGVKLRKPPIFHRVGIPGSGGPDWLRNDYEFVICAAKGRLPWSDNTAMGHAPKYGVGGNLSYRDTTGKRANQKFKQPVKANPGNVITCAVGGHHMGRDAAHKNEAPFPESLAEFFIRSFCPPGGMVLDPFIGGGTTSVAAAKLGRNSIGIDVRKSQIKLCESAMKSLNGSFRQNSAYSRR